MILLLLLRILTFFTLAFLFAVAFIYVELERKKHNQNGIIEAMSNCLFMSSLFTFAQTLNAIIRLFFHDLLIITLTLSFITFIGLIVSYCVLLYQLYADNMIKPGDKYCRDCNKKYVEGEKLCHSWKRM